MLHKVPKSVRNLVWWGKADPIEQKKHLITAIFVRGEMEDIRWALKTFKKQDFIEAVKRPLNGQWHGIGLNFALVHFGLEIPEKIKKKAIGIMDTHYFDPGIWKFKSPVRRLHPITFFQTKEQYCEMMRSGKRPTKLVKVKAFI